MDDVTSGHLCQSLQQVFHYFFDLVLTKFDLSLQFIKELHALDEL